MNKPSVDFDGLDGIMGDRGPPFMEPPKTPPPPAPVDDAPPWLSPPLTPRTQEASDSRARAPVTAHRRTQRMLPPAIAVLIMLGFIGAMGVALGTLIVHAAHVARAPSMRARAPAPAAPTAPRAPPPVVNEPAPSAVAPLAKDAEHAVDGPKLRRLFPAAFNFNSTQPALWPTTNALRTLIELLRKCEGTIVATGHTCNVGKEDANIRKGMLRAEAAREILVRQGIDAARIQVTSAGSREPVASNATLKGRRANRRVTVSCTTSQ